MWNRIIGENLTTSPLLPTEVWIIKRQHAVVTRKWCLCEYKINISIAWVICGAWWGMIHKEYKISIIFFVDLKILCIFCGVDYVIFISYKVNPNTNSIDLIA
jgi:hypothetical protein